MNKVEKTLVAIAIVGMVGFVFAISTLKGIPEAFDWEEDDE
jgi:preprotein translocase subunit Sss1